MSTRTRSSIYITSALILFVSSCALAWTGPTATAPSANTSAPLNVGSLDQVKNASIGVNGLAVFGNTILSGISGNTYLNFGTTAGSTGYGIRDNAGTLEFKNNGGSWTSLGGMQAWTTNGTTISNTNTGNVGIGTTTPAQKLTVLGTIRANLLQAYSGSGGYAALNQGNTSQSGYVSWFKPDGITRMAYLGWWPTDLVLNLENGSDFGILNGNVGIGTTTPGQKLDVVGNINVSGNITATAFVYSSDLRLKKDITPMQHNLDALLQLQPVSWHWKDSKKGIDTQIGFIAQDVQRIVPGVVHTDPSTTMESIDYARLIPLLTGAIQELNEKVEQQQRQIDKQRKIIEDLVPSVKN